MINKAATGSIIGFVILIILGYIGNYFTISFVFDIKFVFGSIAALIAVRLYGFGWGTFAAFIISLYTIVLWQVPCAVVTFTFEALFVGWGLRSKSNNLLILDIIYWLFLGMPSVWLLYSQALGLDTESVVLIMLKQAINGIFNALIASLFTNYIPIYGWTSRLKASKVISFEQILVNLLVAFVLIPVIIIMAWGSRNIINSQENNIQINLHNASKTIAYELRSWHEQSLAILKDIALEASNDSNSLSALQQKIELIERMFPSFLNINILKNNGNTIAHSEEKSLNLPKLSKFDTVEQIKILNSSNDIVIVQSVPVIINNQLVANIIAEIDKDFLHKLLTSNFSNLTLKISLIDSKYHVVLSTRKDLTPLQKFDHQDGQIRFLRERVYQWTPISYQTPNLTRLLQSFYVEESFISQDIPWTLVVEVPSIPLIKFLEHLYIKIFIVLLIIAVLASLVAKSLSRRLVKPIWKLAEITTNLPDKVLYQKEINLTTSPIMEINALANNFYLMAIILNEKFQEINIANQEIQKAKEIADNANQAKTEFLSNMSHELRTPLNGILGYAQIIQKSTNLTPEEQKGIKIISQCGHHLLTLINDILDIAKIEARKMELYATEFHFLAFLEGVVEMCRLKAEEKNLIFSYQADSQLPIAIHADQKRLRQVLINLISNAIKFTDTGKVIFKVNKLINNKIHFQIEDTGVGMTKQQLQRIFLPFEQVGDSKKQREGTGLGLAISQKIVFLMGSTIEVQSQLGKGSIFSFDLELLEFHEWQENSKDRLTNIIGFRGNKRRILIVDDQWENRSIIVNLLQSIGFEVIEASNGKEGLEKALIFEPDVVITDVIMPIMDGLHMIKCLRKLSQFQEITIITSSASVSESEQHQSLDAGADEFLAKPVSAAILFSMLHKYLQLEWIYSNQTQSTDEFQPPEIVPPSADIIMLLYDLTKKGDLDQLLNEITTLELLNREFLPFVKKVTELAEGFQVKKLQTFLKSFIQSN